MGAILYARITPLTTGIVRTAGDRRGEFNIIEQSREGERKN